MAEAMTDLELCSIVKSLVKDCEAYRDARGVDRTRAMEYYDGTMKDTPADDGRSQVVSRDVRAEIKKVMPSIVRVILGNEKVVEYQPVSQGDEKQADQATDYVNYLAFPESDGPDAVYDAIDDSLLLRNGVIKWWQDVRYDIKEETHTGLPDAAFAQLVSDDSVEALEHTERMETIVDQLSGQSMPVKVHDVRIRRKVKKSRPRLAAVPMEHFLIHPDAIRLEESPLVGESLRIRRSDLVAMGYERDRVDGLPMAGASDREEEIEEQTRRRDVAVRDEIAAKAMQEVEYYDLLVRIDYDRDGMAELRRVVFAGGIDERYIFENEAWDEVNYADVVCERRPHQWEGNSIADDVQDIQRIKTVLLRQTLDNLYWQNNQQPIVQESAIVNPEAVTNPAFGLPVRVTAGTDVRAALGYNVVPFVADKSFQMLAYLDQEKHDRTGITDASSGLAPDALQNMTAKASAMIEAAGIGQTEMMVRTIAQCLKPVFKGLLKLLIQHQDVPRTVRLRGKWVQFDPRTWNADMDVTVNTGLGAGTRERDMMMMQIVVGAQKELLTAFGLEKNPYVKPDQLYNGVAKMVAASGLKGVDQFLTNPSPDELQQFAQAQSSKMSPEQVKIEGEKQIKQLDAQLQIALKDKDIQKDASKEAAQRDADLVIKQAELEKETAASMHEAELKAHSDAAKLEFEREKLASHERVEYAKLALQAELERERMDREDRRAESDRQAKARQPEMVQ